MKGRLCGTEGEELAANYIARRMTELKLKPYQANSYIHPFTFREGKRVSSKAYFSMLGTRLNIGSDVIPLPYSGGDRISGSAMPGVDEKENLWLVPVKPLALESSRQPDKILYEKAKLCIEQGASAVVFFNDASQALDRSMESQSKFEKLTAPVVYLNFRSYQNVLKPGLKSDWIDIDARLGFEDANITGRNVCGMIDHYALQTVLICCDYDHLGSEPQIYPGANHNASAVASLLALGARIQENDFKNYNYLLVAFSGSENHFQGVQQFIKENGNRLGDIKYVIDLSRMGQLNRSSREVFISGVGSSATWGEWLQRNNKNFALRMDSSGSGYGSYSWFYHIQKPVLCFSTGFGIDYHRVSDEASRINYQGQQEINQFVFQLLADMENVPVPVFQTTNNLAERIAALKNDMGIIPDYSFADDGIRIAACLFHKAADKSGLQADDIITQIGEFPVIDFDDFMKVMNKIEAGRETPVTVKRGKNEFKFYLSF